MKKPSRLNIKIFKFSIIIEEVKKILSSNIEIENSLFESYFLIEEVFGLRKEKILQYFNEDLLSVSDVLFFRIFEKKIQDSGNQTFLRESFSRELILELQKKISQRMKNIPLAYIFKKASFDGNIFFVSRHVLIPRFDSEILIEKAVECFQRSRKERLAESYKVINILDICSGSGCLGIAFCLRIISILQNAKKDNEGFSPNYINLYFVDISTKALSVVKKNFKNLIKNSSTIDYSGLKIEVRYLNIDILKEKDFKAIVPESFFDYILYNPPYIETDIIADLSQEVQKEPILALDGGRDGLKFYRIMHLLCDRIKRDLQKRFFIEIGYNQKEAIENICSYNNLAVSFYKDFGGNFRLAIL